MKLVIKNSITLEVLTSIAGHTQYLPIDDFENVFGGEFEEKYGNDYSYSNFSEFLDEKGFYEWCKLPDGSDAWSDYGLTPIFKIINEYDDVKTTPEETLILINRCLDVYHQRGDLASCFIQGGWRTCSKISNGEPLNEDIEEANYQAPDSVDYQGGIYNWRDRDAIPFFVLADGSIECGEPGKRHMDYTEKFSSEFSKRQFVDDIIFQGRYWKDGNMFSFWYIDWGYYSDQYIINIMGKVCREYGANPLKAKLAYKDHVYGVMKDGERYYLNQEESTLTRTSLTSEMFDTIDDMFIGNMNFFRRENYALVKMGQTLKARPLNDYEALAGGCHQMMADFFHKTNTKFNKDDFRMYIAKKYNTSFDELIDYFESVLRNRLVSRFRKDDSYQTFSNFQDEIMSMANECGIGDTEVIIKPYQDGNPYSYNVRTINRQAAAKLCELAKERGFIVDRVLSRVIDPESKMTMQSFRIRRPAE